MPKSPSDDFEKNVMKALVVFLITCLLGASIYAYKSDLSHLNYRIDELNKKIEKNEG